MGSNARRSWVYSVPMNEDTLAEHDLPHVLVVDDDDRLRDLLRQYLSDNGFRVSVAEDAAAARARLKSMAFDAMVLDVMMPGETGLELAADLKRLYPEPLPILMLTAMGEADDRVAGLESGADDYLTKPFEPRELLLRLNNIRHRAPAASPGRAGDAARAQIALGTMRWDAGRAELLDGEGAPVKLTSLEAALLGALAERPGAVLSRDDLVALTGTGTSGVAGSSGEGRAVDVQVTRLRRKIELDPKFPRYLQTVRGRGYVLKPD